MEASLTTTSPPMITTDTDDGPNDNPKVITALTVLEAFILILGVFGNSMLFLLMRSKTLSRHSFSVYFSFAAIFDTLNIFWNTFQDVFGLFHPDGPEQEWVRSYTFGCGLLEEMDGMFPVASSWLMVFLCIDRYISICHPTASQTFCRRSVALFVCSSIFLFSFIYGLPWPLIVPDKADINPDDGPIRCGEEPTDNLNNFQIADEFITYFIPVLTVTILNVLILVKLNRKNAFRDGESLTEHGKEQTKLNRLNVSIFYLLVITAMTWLPYAIVSFLEIVNPTYYDGSTDVAVNFNYAWHVTLDLWLFTFAQDFYVLMLMSPVYRKEMRRQCACLPWCRKVDHERLDVDAGIQAERGDRSNDSQL